VLPGEWIEQGSGEHWTRWKVDRNFCLHGIRRHEET
jgi:hypothetical protein